MTLFRRDVMRRIYRSAWPGFGVMTATILKALGNNRDSFKITKPVSFGDKPLKANSRHLFRSLGDGFGIWGWMIICLFIYFREVPEKEW